MSLAVQQSELTRLEALKLCFTLFLSIVYQGVRLLENMGQRVWSARDFGVADVVTNGERVDSKENGLRVGKGVSETKKKKRMTADKRPGRGGAQVGARAQETNECQSREEGGREPATGAREGATHPGRRLSIG